MHTQLKFFTTVTLAFIISDPLYSSECTQKQIAMMIKNNIAQSVIDEVCAKAPKQKAQTLEATVADFIKKNLRLIAKRDFQLFNHTVEGRSIHSVAEAKKYFRSEKRWKKNFPGYDSLSEDVIEQITVERTPNKRSKFVSLTDKRDGQNKKILTEKFYFTVHIPGVKLRKDGRVAVYIKGDEIFWQPFGW